MVKPGPTVPTRVLAAAAELPSTAETAKTLTSAAARTPRRGVLILIVSSWIEAGSGIRGSYGSHGRGMPVPSGCGLGAPALACQRLRLLLHRGARVLGFDHRGVARFLHDFAHEPLDACERQLDD